MSFDIKKPLFLLFFIYFISGQNFSFLIGSQLLLIFIEFQFSTLVLLRLSLQKSERICSNFSKPILNDRSSPPHILVLRNRRIINEWHTFDVNIQIQGMGGSKITISRAPSSSPLCADTHSHFWKKKIPSWWKGKKKLFIIKRNALWIFYTSGTSV